MGQCFSNPINFSPYDPTFDLLREVFLECLNSHKQRSLVEGALFYPRTLKDRKD